MHRIQRVPQTERRGRVHTSTVGVALLSDTTSRRISLNEEDLHKRWHSGTGAGGQHRNKTQNCLELTHRPSGLSVTANGRSRKDNEREARLLLQKALEDRGAEQERCVISQERRSQAGDRSRSGERIRTWKFQEDKVIDHQSGISARARDILRKGVSSLWPDKDRE